MKDDNIINPDIMTEFGEPLYGLFAKWRKDDPVHWNPPNSNYDTSAFDGWSLDEGFYVLTKYEDVVHASKTPDIFSSFEGGPIVWDLDEDALNIQRAGMMGMDPPHHIHFKKLVMPPLLAKSIRKFDPLIEKMAKRIVAGLEGKDECEFVFDVSSRLPVYTFCELMGIPEEEREIVFKTGNEYADIENRAAQAEDPIPALFEIAERLSEDKRQNPDDTMLSTYVNSQIDGERLTQDQINMFFATFAVAGHETTRATAAHFMRFMKDYPEQYDLLLSDMDHYLPNAIEEVLRFAPPVQNFRRTLMKDYELSGKTLKKGDKIYLSYPAANRDSSIFENPDIFDITRANARKHLSFGFGQHVCIGAQLARRQLFLLLKEFLQTYPNYEFTRELKFMRSIMFNGIIAMPMRL